MKKLLTSIALGAVAGVAFVQWFDRCVSPDLGFFQKAAEKSDQWAEKLRETDEPCYIICGSSDVRMGMDPETMQEEGVRAICSAYNAGYGQNVLLMEALRMSRKGDTLVMVPLSPENDPDQLLTGSMKLAFLREGVGLFEPGLIHPSPGNISKIFTGDIRTINSFFIKAMMGAKHTYRYNEETCVIHESGWVELLPTLRQTQLCRKQMLRDRPLTERAKLRDIGPVEEKCREYGLDFIIQIPLYCKNESYRAVHTWEALQYVRQGYKVLKDPYLGVEDKRAYAGDTPNHVRGEGAKVHSRHLAKLLKQGEFWTAEELVQELNKMGWNGDGTAMEGWEEQNAGKAE